MIFNTIVNPTRQEAVADQIVRLGNQTLLQLTATYLRAYDLVWKDPDPAGVIAALGTQAQAVFTHSAALAAFINSFGQTQVAAAAPAGWTVTFNADGSATAAQTTS